MDLIEVQDFLRFFPVEEIKCKGSGECKIDPRIIEPLFSLRFQWDRPLYSNSFCRNPSHNTKIGGHPRSLHLTENPHWPTYGSMAIDIRWRDWDELDKLAFCQLALEKGFRVGLNNGFVHLDMGLLLGLTNSVFVYGSYTGDLHIKLREV